MNLSNELFATEEVAAKPAKKAPAKKPLAKNPKSKTQIFKLAAVEMDLAPATPAAQEALAEVKTVPAKKAPAKIDYAQACVDMAKNVATKYMEPATPAEEATPADSGVLAAKIDDATLELRNEIVEMKIKHEKELDFQANHENHELGGLIDELDAKNAELKAENHGLLERIESLRETMVEVESEKLEAAVTAAVRENELMLMATIELLTSKITALNLANKALEEKVANTAAGELTDISECCLARWNIFKNFHLMSGNISLSRDESRLNTTEISELVRFGYLEATIYTQNNKPAARITKLLK